MEIKDKRGNVTGIAYYDDLPEGTNHDWNPVSGYCRKCGMASTGYFEEPRSCVSRREEIHDAIGYDS
jgi:hypothetical protein